MARWDGRITRLEFRDGKLERIYVEDNQRRTGRITISSPGDWPPVPISSRGLHAVGAMTEPAITIEVPDA